MKRFIKTYLDELEAVARSLPDEAIAQLIRVMAAAHRAKARIFVIGNGGSAATASHFACDLAKNAVPEGRQRFKVLALTDSTPAITAYGNDNGFSSVFKEQLVNLLEPGDVVMAISASGNSPNIIEAVIHAREMGATVIGLAGFDGGKLGQLAHHAIVTPAKTYEQAEDLHMILTHMIVSWFKAHPEALD